jgi:hypothetical protein
LRHVPRTDPDPTRPLVGNVEVAVNLELAPFIVSSSFGKPLIVNPDRGQDDSVMGRARFAFFKTEGDPLWPLLELVCSKGEEGDWPNYLRRELDAVAVETARSHLAYSDLGCVHAVTHVDCELDFGDETKVFKTEHAPQGVVLFSAEPEFVGTVITVGQNAGYIVHNLWRGVYVVDGR